MGRRDHCLRIGRISVTLERYKTCFYLSAAECVGKIPLRAAMILCSLQPNLPEEDESQALLSITNHNQSNIALLENALYETSVVSRRLPLPGCLDKGPGETS